MKPIFLFYVTKVVIEIETFYDTFIKFNWNINDEFIYRFYEMHFFFKQQFLMLNIELLVHQYFQ